MSLAEKLMPVFHLLPEVSIPKRHIPFKEKLTWSAVILVVYFVLGEIPLYGMTGTSQDYFGYFKAVLASEQGTLITLGIGPVVMAGIFMQLFQGAEIFKFDLTTHEGKTVFQGLQKLLAIFLCIFEAFMFVWGGAFGRPGTNVMIFLMLQMAAGAFLVLLMDEVVTKWGFGSGVSLFIAGGVAKDIIWRTFSVLEVEEYPGQWIGAIPQFVRSVIAGTPTWTRAGLPDMVQVLFTVLIFVVVVYAESMRVEIPLSYGKYKGVRGRYPIRFIYASVIPVILTSAMIGSANLVARLLNTRFGWEFLGTFEGSSATSGLMYYLSPPVGLDQVASEPIRALVYLLVMVGGCILFATMWIELTNMGPRSVAERLQQSGMQIPGFRRDPRVVEKVLNRYIPKVTIMGGATIGLLAAFATFTNALGTGTGILLTVGIVYRMYEDLMREQMSEMFPALRSFLGE
ncbi:MAG: preprotein translocase subunit SecY [Theionarchaea archaeon]|nr:preprotein translocase subunit SecY [Theionarchaea archaeon]MBU7001763.1 preprotein translocase subunit SecY [Theionarchaea archaeon]MBU7022288.1 preprotein translocase subunit SecY [Theionarchaea archaeon]MBU7035522.1 preprotein translocase subunit SecY [Theionarchaea archaeon]MBU7041131.1 preprotein translocase subunit SecY [Theionarchaea archaeon]